MIVCVTSIHILIHAQIVGATGFTKICVDLGFAFISSPELKAHRAYSIPVEPSSVCVCVCVSVCVCVCKHFKTYISPQPVGQS